MQVACPSCQENLHVPDEHLRQGVAKVRCAHCSFSFVIRLGDPGSAPPRREEPTSLEGVKASGGGAAAASGEIGGGKPRFFAADTLTSIHVDPEFKHEIKDVLETIVQAQEEPGPAGPEESAGGRPEPAAPEPGAAGGAIPAAARSPEAIPAGEPSPARPEPSQPAARASHSRAAATMLGTAPPPSSVIHGPAESAGIPPGGDPQDQGPAAPERKPILPPLSKKKVLPPQASGKVLSPPATGEPLARQQDRQRVLEAAKATLRDTEPVADLPSLPPGERPTAAGAEEGTGAGEDSQEVADSELFRASIPSFSRPPAAARGVTKAPREVDTSPAGSTVSEGLAGRAAQDGAYPVAPAPAVPAAAAPAPAALAMAPAAPPPLAARPEPMAAQASLQPYAPRALSSVTGPHPFVQGPVLGFPTAGGVPSMDAWAPYGDVLPAAAHSGKAMRALGILMTLVIFTVGLFFIFVVMRNGWSLDISRFDEMVSRAFGGAAEGDASDELRAVMVSDPVVEPAQFASGEKVLLVRGVVKNNDTRTLRFIYVKATLMRHGNGVNAAEAPAGNLLTADQLKGMTPDRVAATTNPAGSNGKNAKVEGGDSLDYAAIISPMPADYSTSIYSVKVSALKAELYPVELRGGE